MGGWSLWDMCVGGPGWGRGAGVLQQHTESHSSTEFQWDATAEWAEGAEDARSEVGGRAVIFRQTKVRDGQKVKRRSRQEAGGERARGG